MPETLTPAEELQAVLPRGDAPLAEAAVAYARRGWHVFPLKPRDKPPLVSGGFHSASRSLNDISIWWSRSPDANIGLAPAASGLVVFDIDSAAAEEVARELGLLDVETLVVRTGRAEFAGRHLYFRSPGIDLGNPRLGVEGGRLVKVGGRSPGLEVKANAGYVVAPPSIHPSGTRYAFEEPCLEPASLPPDSLAAIQALLRRSEPNTPNPAAGTGGAPTPGEVEGEPRPVVLVSSSREEGVSLADAKLWLKALAPERCEDYHGWVGVLMGLHHQFAGTSDEAEVLAVAIEWSMESGKYQNGDVEEKWRSFSRSGTKSEVTIRSLRRWADEDRSQRHGCPVLDCTISSETTLTVPTWRVIAERNDPEPRTYWSNGSLAGLRPRPDDTLYVAPFTQETLSQHLAEKVADFKRRSRAGLTPCYPPMGLIKQLLANPAPPVELPKLRRVVPVPIFAATGELITTPGYHRASQTFYAPPRWLGALTSVPDRPTGAHVEAAIRIFDEHIGCNFPFDEDGGASRAHALALALQGFVVDVIDQITPLFDIEAAQRRTGKGLLTECCLMPAFGPTLAGKRTPMPKTDEEMTKVLTAHFKDGGLLIAFDNVKGEVDFASLEAALTAESFEGRVLGSSTLIQAQNRATWVMISNNPEMSGDLAGRSIRIRLVSPVEYPEDRTDFARLQPTYTRTHLPELIWGLQTLVRHWFAEGCPRPPGGTPGLGSYSRWREVIGGILYSAGIEGFLRNRSTLRRDVSRGDMQFREFVGAWRDRDGTSPVPTSDLVASAEEYGIPLSGDTPRAKATALGIRLSKCAGVHYFDRYTIENRKRGGERQWCLVDQGVGCFESGPPSGIEDLLGTAPCL